MHGNECPVGYYASNAEGAIVVSTSDEIFDCSGVEKLDVGEREDFGQEHGSKESLWSTISQGREKGSGGSAKTYSMLHDNKVALILEWNSEVVQERISGLAHDHCTEKLASEPGPTARRDRSFDDSNLQVRTSFAKHVGRAEATRSSADNDNVRLSIGIEVIEIAASHGAGNLRLADRSELEALLPLFGEFIESFGLVAISIDRERLDVKSGLQGNTVKRSSGHIEHCCWWCHCD